MSETEKEQWSHLLTKVQASPVWEQELQKHNWTGFYKNSEETAVFLDNEYRKYHRIMQQK